MNIIKKELKLGLKQFMFWSLGLFVLDIAGLIKFSGISESGTSMSAIVEMIPRIVQALFGIVDIDILKIEGYYAILIFFVMLCSCIYAITLASNAVSRETIDKTYEFIFTKPRSRSYILSMKLIAGWIYLTLFIILNIIFSLIGLSFLDLQESIIQEILLNSCTVYLVSLVYFSVTVCIASMIKRADKGSFYGNLFFSTTFMFGVMIDMIEKPGIIRVLSPLKYFTQANILNHSLPWGYVGVSCLLIILSMCCGYYHFSKRDMNAVN